MNRRPRMMTRHPAIVSALDVPDPVARGAGMVRKNVPDRVDETRAHEGVVVDDSVRMIDDIRADDDDNAERGDDDRGRDRDAGVRCACVAFVAAGEDGDVVSVHRGDVTMSCGDRRRKDFGRRRRRRRGDGARRDLSSERHHARYHDPGLVATLEHRAGMARRARTPGTRRRRRTPTRRRARVARARRSRRGVGDETTGDDDESHGTTRVARSSVWTGGGYGRRVETRVSGATTARLANGGARAARCPASGRRGN